MKIAIIGSGVSGLGSAWLLSKYSHHKVTLYEKEDYLGGHSHTVDYHPPTDSTKSVPVDTGFIVFNLQTYPNLVNFFKHLSIPSIPSIMSFSVSKDSGAFEYSGTNLLSLFAQTSNIINPEFYSMLGAILKFNKVALEALSLPLEHRFWQMSVKEALDWWQLPLVFFRDYLIPMTSAIWSTPPEKCLLEFPAFTLIRFMHNHSLLQVTNRPQWLTVEGGSRAYVKKIAEGLNDVRLNTPVVKVVREKGGVMVTDANGKTERFDHVIFASHADTTLSLLQDATEKERKILGKCHFSKNKAVLHCDENLMPQRRACWSSWNFKTNSDPTSKASISDTPCFIPENEFGPIFVTLNPIESPAPDKTIAEYEYDHPLYSQSLVEAQNELKKLNSDRISFAGAWMNYGFHEDGFTSGLRAAIALGATCPFEVVDASHIKPIAIQRVDYVLGSFVELVSKAVEFLSDLVY